MDMTDRWGLPLIAAGQAQKEMTHNEALATVDLLVQPAVTGVGGNAPPAAPFAGECWIVGPAPTGAWAGRPGSIAGWTAGGWRFIAPREGAGAWSIADGVAVRYAGGGWIIGTLAARTVAIGGDQVVGARGAAVAEPTGGSIVDAQARTAIVAILARMRAHGLIAP